MRFDCPFCKIEYSADVAPGRRVECACCGRVWTAAKRRLNWTRVGVVAAALMILAAVAVLIMDFAKTPESERGPIRLLVANVARNDGGFVIQGRIQNQTEAMQGVPNLVVKIMEGDGYVLSQQKMPPPAGILDIGEAADFSFDIKTESETAAKVSIEWEK